MFQKTRLIDKQDALEGEELSCGETRDISVIGCKMTGPESWCPSEDLHRLPQSLSWA